MVPHLTTALAGPLLELEQRFLDRMPDIERWLRTQWQEHAVPFYASVDLRNAGFKLAPVDTNLFPGGFNNLNPAFLPLCVQAIQAAVERVCPDARGVLLVPENHTRNTFYLQNVETLAEHPAPGRHARAHRLAHPGPRRRRRRSSCRRGGSLTLEPIVRNGRRVGLADFDPCMVLLNNDLSAGAPPILAGHRPADRAAARRRLVQPEEVASLRASSIASRRSSRAMLGIDPWLIDPYFGVCGKIDFQERAGEECLASNVVVRCSTGSAPSTRSTASREKPFVIVKADAGTYGMGIMTVRDAVRGHRPQPQAAQQDGGGEGRARSVARSSSRKACRRSSRSTTRSPSRSST